MARRSTAQSLAAASLLLLLTYHLRRFSCSAFSYPRAHDLLCHRGPSRFFLDTASTEQWSELLPLGIFHGITTNPTILERCNVPCTVASVQSLASNALDVTDEFMCQSWGGDADMMYSIGMELSSVDRTRVVVKCPVTAEGTKAASRLIGSGVRVCLTACYSKNQALVAAACGAEYIAPYLGRMTDAGRDGLSECRSMQSIVKGMGSSTRILVASIRKVEDMCTLACCGCDTFTFSPDVARAMFAEELTAVAAKDFEDAALRNKGAKSDEK
ncbi:tal [Symbiodinium natans]|uniref:Tal protein n=1 Tax=Symbiodinium natans TaxID=878477 RepID=A0A812TVC3_9DINO|nr:tal [Symbiodinium natans]